MITLDFSFAGVAALTVALTQWSKNIFHIDEKYPGKKWPSQLLSFASSVICCFLAVGIGVLTNVGCFAEFAFNSVESWFTFLGTVVFCTGFANGLWTYTFMEKILGFLKLIKSKKEENKTEENKTE